MKILKKSLRDKWLKKSKLKCHWCCNENQYELSKTSITPYDKGYECKNKNSCVIQSQLKWEKEGKIKYCSRCGNRIKSELKEVRQEWGWKIIKYKCKNEYAKQCNKRWKLSLDSKSRRELRNEFIVYFIRDCFFWITLVVLPIIILIVGLVVLIL